MSSRTSARGSRASAGDAADDDLVFRALADSRRRRILDLLQVRARTTGELCEHFADLDRCTVMQHIGVLERAGLVVSRREGRLRWNHLDVMPIKEIHDRWISPYAASAVRLLARMKRELETEHEGVAQQRAK
jgi:DNA-binding transcriptional ArsR family regulator